MVADKTRKKGKSRTGGAVSKRKPPVGFRANDEELAQIKAYADRAGLTVGSYVRSRALRTPTTPAVRRPSVQTAQLAQILGLIGIMGSDIQEIAKLLTGAETAKTDTRIEVTDTLSALREASTSIMRLLGKRKHDY